MKYFFVCLHTSSRSSGNARPKHSKCFGFGVVSICRCLIWVARKKAWFKGWIFSLISVPKDHVHFYMQYICLCIELSERVTGFCCECPQPYWMESKSQIPSPVFWWEVSSGIPSRLATMVLNSTRSPPRSQLLPFRRNSIIHLSILCLG